jgi:hypothetical protein
MLPSAEAWMRREKRAVDKARDKVARRAQHGARTRVGVVAEGRRRMRRLTE